MDLPIEQQLEDSQHEFPFILAPGSPHGDDQAGWLVADALECLQRFRGRCRKLATPWDLLAHLNPSGDQIIVDASISGSVPGTVHELTPQQLEAFQGTLTSSHGGSLATTLQLARTLGYDISRIIIYAVEIDSAEPGRPVSDAMLRGVGELVGRIARVGEWNLSQDAQSVGESRDA